MRLPTGTAKRESQVRTEMSTLSNDIGVLQEELDRLETRLECVLVQNNPSAEEIDTSSEELVSLAIEIKADRARVLDITSKIRSMLSRLEL